MFHAGGVTAISRWLSASDTTGLRPTGTSTPDGVPAGDLIGRHEAAIPAGMDFLRRLFRWWRFADHRLMALKPPASFRAGSA